MIPQVHIILRYIDATLLPVSKKKYREALETIIEELQIKLEAAKSEEV